MGESAKPRQSVYLAAIALAAVAAFLPALRNNFVHDDRPQVQELTAPTAASGWLKSPAQPWWPPSHAKNIWRPLTRVTILAQKAIHDNTGWPFYAVNILLHALASVLLYLLARRLGMSAGAALCGALMFAVHPIHAEAVHQVVGRAEILCATFVILGLLAVPPAGGTSASAYDFRLKAGRRMGTLAALCFALALASKESAVVFPLLFALVLVNRDGWPAVRRSWFWMLLAALGAVLLVFLWGKAAVTGGLIEPASTVPPHENPLARMNFLQRLPAGLGILFDAAVQLVVPLGLSPDYSAVSLPVEDGWRWPLAWLGAMACLALAAWALRNARRGGRGWMIAAAAVGCWLPLSNIFSPIGVVTAERLWYLPSAAACLGAGALLAAAWEAQPSAFAQRRTLRELPVVLLLAWLMTSLFYARAWRTQAGYAEWTVRRFPGSWRGHINLADADYHARQFTDGVIEGRRAVEIMPGIALGWDWRGLNAAFAGPQYWAEAEGALRRALQLDARLVKAHEHLALLYEMQGRRADAIREYEAYLAAGQADDGATIARRLERLRKE